MEEEEEEKAAVVTLPAPLLHLFMSACRLSNMSEQRLEATLETISMTFPHSPDCLLMINLL